MHRIPLPLPGDALKAVNTYAISDGDGVVMIDGGWAMAEATRPARARARRDRFSPRRRARVPRHPHPPRSLHAGGRGAPDHRRGGVARRGREGVDGRGAHADRASGRREPASCRRLRTLEDARAVGRRARPRPLGVPRPLARRRHRHRAPDPHPAGDRDAGPHRRTRRVPRPGRGRAVRRRPRAAAHHAVDRCRAGASGVAAARLPLVPAARARHAGCAAATRPRSGHRVDTRPCRGTARPPRGAA